MNLTSCTKTRGILTYLWYWLPPLLLMAVIFYFSAQPRLPQARGEWLDALLKKLAHITEYTILFLLFFRAWRRNRHSRQALDRSWLATAAYAVSDEVHQAFVPGRHANGYDVVIDVSVALLLWWLLRQRRFHDRLRAQDQDLAK